MYLPETSFELEHDFEAGKGASGIVWSAVVSEVLDELELRQLNPIIHNQWHVDLWQPLEHQVLCRVGHWTVRTVSVMISNETVL